MTDRHEVVSEIKWLSTPQWKIKYEFAIGATDSAMHYDERKCVLLGVSKNRRVEIDLTDRLGVIYDKVYLGLRLIDVMKTNLEEMVLYMQYSYGHNGPVKEFASQFRCRQVLMPENAN